MVTDTKIPSLLGLKWWIVDRKVGAAQVRFRYNKRPIAISTGKKASAEVTEAEAKALIEDWFLRNAKRLAAPAPRPGSLAAEVARFMKFRCEGLKPSTTREIARHLRELMAALRVDDVSSINSELCEARRDALVGSKAPRETKKLLTTWRRFCRWQAEEGNLRGGDPFRNFRTPKSREFPVHDEVWSDERFEGTLRHLRGDDAEMLSVVRWSGMDIADIWGLEPSHLLRVPFLKFWKVRAKAKSSLERIDQPVSSRILPIIERRLADAISKGTKLWPDTGKMHTFGTLFLDRVKTAQRKAGFESTLGMKALRHTFGTYHAGRFLRGEGGPPESELRRWFGHAPDSRTLERLYIHVESNDRFMD